MKKQSGVSSLSVVSTETLTPHLTDEQLECLSRCAKGISLRFEASEIVDALVAGGYVKEGVARVVAVTAMGLKYLQTHAS
jgi:hypothetical protein